MTVGADWSHNCPFIVGIISTTRNDLSVISMLTSPHRIPQETLHHHFAFSATRESPEAGSKKPEAKGQIRGLSLAFKAKKMSERCAIQPYLPCAVFQRWTYGQRPNLVLSPKPHLLPLSLPAIRKVELAAAYRWIAASFRTSGKIRCGWYERRPCQQDPWSWTAGFASSKRFGCIGTIAVAGLWCETLVSEAGSLPVKKIDRLPRGYGGWRIHLARLARLPPG